MCHCPVPGQCTRSRAEGDGRSDANQCCDMKADLATIGPEATLKRRRCVGPKRDKVEGAATFPAQNFIHSRRRASWVSTQVTIHWLTFLPLADSRYGKGREALARKTNATLSRWLTAKQLLQNTPRRMPD